MTTAAPHGPAETERRRVTVMFADIVGFTSLVEHRDNEQAYEAVTGCLKLLDSIARSHGGAVDKYLGDCIMAVFGAPVAIEDAPRAAVNAAIEMLRRLADYNREHELPSPLEVHIGINTGLAISGDVSGPVMREFALLGDPVNVASRLRDRAPRGEVYVGEETWAATRDLFEYEALPPQQVKGKEHPVRAFRLLSRREQLERQRGKAAASLFSELVGRDGLMTELRAALGMLAKGRGGVHVLVGEAGVGKTRVLDEISRAPEAVGLEWLRAAGVATHQNVAYHLFARLLRVRLAIADEEPEESARARLGAALEAVLPDGASDARPIVASIMGLRLDPDEQRRVASYPWDTLDRVILHTMTELLAALVRVAPAVIVLDDVQWADGSSLKLLARLLRIAGGHPVLFLLGARDAYPETTGHLLGILEREQAGGFRHHPLGPLSQGDSRRLLRNLVRQGNVPSEFLMKVEEETRGNPFFMEEVVRSLVETGALVERPAGMDLIGPHEAITIPNSIHDVVMARIDRLPRGARAVVQAASVVGPLVHEAVLAAALPEAEDLPATLGELEALGMLRRASEARGWQFPHPLIREVAYDSMLTSRREELHRRVAGAVIERLGENVPGYHAMLAYHLTHGRDLEAAEEHLLCAGEEATKLAAADEALQLFYDAAGLYLKRHPDGGDPRQRADLERNIARAHANRGELTEAIAHINLALEALGERVPRSNVARVWNALPGAWAALRLVTVPRRRPRPPAGEREQRVIELMFDRARAQVTAAPAPTFVFDGFDTFRKIEAVDPRSVVGVGGMIAGGVGILTWAGVSPTLARRFLEKAGPLVDEENEAEAFLFRMMRFLERHQEGSWDEGDEIPSDRVEGAIERGLLWDVTNYLVLLGERRVACGSFAAGAALVRQLARIGDHFHYDLARSSERYVRLLLELERGDLPAALRTAQAYYTEHQEKRLNALALGNRAKAELLAGDLDAARSTLEASGGILAAERLLPPFYQAPHCRSRLLLAVLELRAAPSPRERRRAARRARAHARRARSAASRLAARAPEVLRLDAERLYWSGHEARAWQRAEESLRLAGRLGTIPDAARAHAMLGDLLAREGTRREVAGRDAAGHRAEAARLWHAGAPFHWAEVAPPPA